ARRPAGALDGRDRDARGARPRRQRPRRPTRSVRADRRVPGGARRVTAAKPQTRMTPAGHRYYLDGDRVPNVTGLLGGGAPRPGLIKWAAERPWGYAIDHWAELAALPISERIKLLEGARFEHLGEAKERGTEVHAQIVRWLHGEDVVPPAGLEGHVDAAIAFCEAWQLAEVLLEAPVFSRTWRYAGRLDLVGDL